MGGAILLAIGSLVAGLYGAGVWMRAESAMHQITAALFFVVAAVLFSSGLIVEAIARAGKRTSAEHGALGRAQDLMLRSRQNG